MLRLTGAIVLAVSLTACAGSPASSPKPTHAAPSASGPTFDITSFGPQGHNVEVDFQVTNSGSVEWRLVWSKLILTDPKGQTHACYRDPSSAPYEIIDPDGASFAGGCTFQMRRYVPGHYEVDYDGRVLKEKSL